MTIFARRFAFSGDGGGAKSDGFERRLCDVWNELPALFCSDRCVHGGFAALVAFATRALALES